MPRRPAPPSHPPQPLIRDERDDTVRFKPNSIVRFLLDAAGRGERVTLETIEQFPFEDEDRQQFLQLLGYTLTGYSEVGCVDNAAWQRATKQPIPPARATRARTLRRRAT